MLEDGVTERIRTLLRSDMPPVQFKLLGTLRMMVDGQGNKSSQHLCVLLGYRCKRLVWCLSNNRCKIPVII